jgi:agmatine/peptidylarginine deiminase
MVELKKTIKTFSLSEDSRRKLLNGSNDAPPEFIDIARMVLAGHFSVKDANRKIMVRPTAVELYYHEESEGGIKDPIVYHRNSKNNNEKIFPVGTLHNHVSGIDITFEHGCTPSTAVRASILIREFEVNGKNDERSTKLYEALYQQASLFDGISIEWVVGDQLPNVVQSPRKNVAMFYNDRDKMKAKDHPEQPHTIDGKFVQDMRKWQFKKKRVFDPDSNTVYISGRLESEHPDFYNRFVNILSSIGIPYCVMQNTNDIWARDYMPIQIYEDHFVQYCYNPDYLRNSDSEEDRESITDNDIVCKELGISCYKSELIIDGGNVVKVGDYIIMTDKVYSENSHLTPDIVRKQLKEIFHANIIMLPWDKYEIYGHTDGILRAIDNRTVLMTNYEDYDPVFAARFEKILKEHFEVKKLKYGSSKRYKDRWAYINFLHVGKHIIIPGFGVPEDKEALEQIQEYYPECSVHQIECSEIVDKGGALNCITWNIKR